MMVDRRLDEARLRRRQVLAAVTGMGAGIASLLGGSQGVTWLAWGGAVGFLLAAAAVLGFGWLAWRRHG